MHRPSSRRTGFALAGVLLGALPAVAASAPLLTAVVSYDGAAVAVPGVRVVNDLPAVHLAVVRADAAALTRLAHTPGVRGLAQNDAVHLTSGKDDGLGRGVLASAGLDDPAGQPGAGSGVRVAVLDTGVSDTAALDRASGRLVDAADTSRVDAQGGAVRTGGVYPDGYGHGTFMADLVAGGAVPGTHGQALGIAPGATVLDVRVARRGGTTSLAAVVAGLDWVAQHADQVDVANLSFSHDRPSDAYGSDPLTDAVEQVRAAGVVVVVAAGNDPGRIGDPGLDPQALTVGAADLGTGRTALFSGSGVVAGVRKPDVVANGVHVLGLLPDDSVLAREDDTLHLSNGLYRGSGTSQATAVVSGLAALVLADHPRATPAQVKATLRCSADDLRGRRDGAGLVTVPRRLCGGRDGTSRDGSSDLTGEGSFDASSWSASSWSASSWSASSWSASSWSASSWSASSWSAGSWSAETGDER